MTFHQVECFLETAKAGTISRGAERLFITQQAVSSQLKSLEQELGFPLFQRENKGVSLTPEGALLCEEWTPLWERLQISIDRARDIHIGRSAHIQIAVEDMGKCSEDLLAAFTDYEERYKKVSIDFEISSPRQMLSQLESGRLDMAILYESEFQGHSGLKHIPLHDRMLRVCIFMAKEHPLAKKPGLTLADIQNEPIGILKRAYSFDFQKQLEGFFSHNGIAPPRLYWEYMSRRDLEMGLASKRCVTIVYETMFADEGHKLLEWEIPVPDALSSRIAIFWKKKEMDIKAKALAAILRERLQAVLQESCAVSP